MPRQGRPLRSTRRLQNLTTVLPKWYNIVRNEAGPTLISIYDEIGFFGVTAGEFLSDLAGIPGDIEMHINSPGGDIYEGITIYNRLKDRKGTISVVVDGLAASAASFIAMAASPGQLEMAPRSELMIHNGFTMAIGDAADLRKTADLLERKTNDIADIYAERSGKPAAYWLGKMNAETWYSAKEAVAEGLADRITGQETPRNAWDLSVFDRYAPVVNADGQPPMETGDTGQDSGQPCKTCEGKGRLPHPGTGENGMTCPGCDGSGTYDPDHDGDDDSTAEGDTDHDYVTADGHPGPKAKDDRYAGWHRPPSGDDPGLAFPLRNADKYDADDRKKMAGNGHAMPDGSYPIADEEDLDNAIHAVGRGGADHDVIRAHIIKRAAALGLSSRIPDNWNADGSLKDLSDTAILALFARELDQLDAGRELRVAPKISIPTSNTELEEMLNDPKVYPKIYADPEMRAEFQRKYASAVMASDPELQAQLREQIQMGVAEFVTGNGETRDKVGARLSGGQPQVTVNGAAAIARGRGAAYNKYAPGAQLEQKFKEADRFTSIGDICLAIKEEARPTANPRRTELLRKLENVRSFQNSFGSEDPGAGGFLIPEIMRSELLELAIEKSIVRSRATVIPMSTLRVPIPTVDDTSHVSSLFGGVTYYWAEESSALPESQATFGKVVLDAKKLVGFFKVPNELLADAPAFSAWFDTRIPQGLAWAEDVAFLTETGAGTPEGIISGPAYVQVARGGSNIVTWANLVNMYTRMLPQSLDSAVWIASFDTFPQIAQLSQTNPGIWLGGWAARDASDAPPVSIMGRPIFFTEKVPHLGVPGDISFVDLSYYLVGDRQAVAVSASEHFAFQNDQTAYRIIERVDGRPWLQTPLTPHNNSTATLSAYVGLAAT